MAPGMKGEEGPRCTTPRGEAFSVDTVAPSPCRRQPNCTTETTGRIEAECAARRRSAAPWSRCSAVVSGGRGHEANGWKPGQPRHTF